MDSYKEPAQPELVELSPAPIIWCTGFRLSKTRSNPHFVEYVLFVEVAPLHEGDRPERQVVARVVAPIEIIDPMRRASLEQEIVLERAAMAQ